ncbi:hypothetical protein, partial [Parasutterella muris]|uniref:hypothetical protein n=1 Tax=Parasutterella muris TaxID=2565572 RepID=UPI001F2352C0
AKAQHAVRQPRRLLFNLPGLAVRGRLAPPGGRRGRVILRPSGAEGEAHFLKKIFFDFFLSYSLFTLLSCFFY